MSKPRFANLAEWLAWQETLHHSEIELGLERVAAVAQRMLELPPDYPVLTVAGTNGKGSVCAYLQAILTAAGYRVGVYSSPHLMRYNERIQINGVPVADEALLRAFQDIDTARRDSTLTYFEFATLAALFVFAEAAVDVAVLEVGMGGRLDAVNVVDADIALITNIGLDHQEWLGEDREQIAGEKAGIMRSGRPALCGDRQAPAGLHEHARRIGAQFFCLGTDFDARCDGDTWRFEFADKVVGGLPAPALQGAVQLDNAALALAALTRLGDRFPVALGHVAKGLQSAVLPGRIQIKGRSPRWLLDVCHNDEAAAVLADWLAKNPCKGRTLVVLGMLADKNAQAVARLLAPQADAWYLAGLAGARGQSAGELAARIGGELGAQPTTALDSVPQACDAAREAAGPDDRIVVCGSFHTVGAALAHGI